MREAMGVLQHHDAVTGTAKQAVTDDYAFRLARGFTECEKVIQHGYDVLMGLKEEDKGPRHSFCHLSNITQCSATEGAGDFVVTLYNPLTRRVTRYVRLPVAVAKVGGMEVVDPDGKTVQSQLVPVPKEVLVVPGRRSRASHELVFLTELPPLGFQSFFVRTTSSWLPGQLSRVATGRRRATITNGALSLSTDSRGMLKKLVTADGRAHELRQSFHYYEGHAGHNVNFKDRASGAYIFRPRSQTPTQLNFTTVTKVQGPLVNELHMSTQGGFVSQVARLYHKSEDAELEWLVGPIPISDGIGKEIVTRYSTDIK